MHVCDCNCGIVVPREENEADVTLDIPALPLITARFGGDFSGELSIDGVSESITAASTEHLREEILTRVGTVAGELGRPVQVIIDDDEAQWLLVVHPSGEVGEEERLDVGFSAADAATRVPHAHEMSIVFHPAVVTAEDAEEEGAEEEGAEEEGAEETDPGIDIGQVTVSRSDVASLLSYGTEPDDDEDDLRLARENYVGPPPQSARADDEHPEPEGEHPEPGNVAAEDVAAEDVADEPTTVPPLHIETEPEPAPSSGRASFLAEDRKPDRAKKGWRGFLAKTGLPIPASSRELVERAEIHAVSQHWAGPRTIAIVNGKGGANKTPTTAMLAALFARNGGAGVLAWDNNETRGTLGWRTEQGPHDATVQNLLPNTSRLLSPAAQASDLSHFVHHQTGDKYDVLRSNPKMLATEQRITSDDFDELHSIATKYFRLIFIDSGNDESAERWLRMIDHTDQLVIATTALGEHAEAGALLLEALAQRDERSARLASQAVVIVSQSEKTGSLTDARKVAAGFEPLARRAVSVPFDPSMHGGRLEYSAMAPATRRAWLHAAAAVAEGL
jgi:MinD-like ATPase involved in chromosome partitioning or flagellar assembly